MYQIWIADAGKNCISSEVPLTPAAQAWLEHDPQWCLTRAREIGPACLAVALALFNDQVLVNLRGVQGILRLREKVGDQRLNAACEIAP